MDFMIDLQTTAAFLNAAAAAGGGDPIAAAEEGTSFSDVLAQATGAAQTEDAAQTDGASEGTAQTEETADGTAAQTEAAEGTSQTEGELVTDERGMIYVPKLSMSSLTDLIAKNADEAINKGMKMLFNTMMKAIMGDSSRDKKTDLFSVLSGGSFFDDDDEYGFLFSAELMNNIGFAMDMELAAGIDEDDIIDELDRLLNGMFVSDDDDETDENTAADILAGLFRPDIQEEIVMVVEPEKEELSPVETAAEFFRLPKQIVLKEKPEMAPKMEKLYEEFTAEFRFTPAEEKEDTGLDIRAFIGIDRSAVKVNDAADQIRTMAGEDAPEVPAEIAAAGVQNNAPAESTSEVVPTESDEFIARSVENQITERITEKLFDMKGDNDTEEMVMVLKPENLGHVAVKLVKENGALTVLLSAQYEEVGKLMADRAAALSDSLTSRNVEVKSVQVVDPSSAAEQMGLNFTNQGFGFSRGQEYSSDDSRNSYAGIDAIEETEETEPEINVIREARVWTA